MKDLKRQSNRRPAVRKLGTTSFAVRKNRSNPIPGLSVKLRKPFNEPGFCNSWVPSYFIENEPAVLREKTRWLIQRTFGICGLIFSEILGLGTDVLMSVITSQLLFGYLLALLIGKLILILLYLKLKIKEIFFLQMKKKKQSLNF